MAPMQGMIFDIQHYSLHDGPGVRSTVFFKGCPLACWWCANPESQSSTRQLLFFKNLCTGCGACAAVCPSEALRLTRNGLVMNRKLCTGCGACAETCRNNARQPSGKLMPVEDVCTEVRQHWRIFQQSGGGVTCSGGEALAQPDFLFELLKALHDEIGLHTCLDTCGMAPWKTLERMLPYVDLVLLDIKHINSMMHKMATNAGNKTILSNACALAQRKIDTIIRIPLIPEFNDTDENLHAFGAFLKGNNLMNTEIMPYHVLGMNKHAALGRTYAHHAHTPPRINEAATILKSYGLSVVVHQN